MWNKKYDKCQYELKKGHLFWHFISVFCNYLYIIFDNMRSIFRSSFLFFFLLVLNAWISSWKILGVHETFKQIQSKRLNTPTLLLSIYAYCKAYRMLWSLWYHCKVMPLLCTYNYNTEAKYSLESEQAGAEVCQAQFSLFLQPNLTR